MFPTPLPTARLSVFMGRVGSGRRNDLISFLVMVLKVWFVSQHSGSQPMGLDPFGVQPLFHRGCRSDILHVIYLYYDS